MTEVIALLQYSMLDLLCWCLGARREMSKGLWRRKTCGLWKRSKKKSTPPKTKMEAEKMNPGTGDSFREPSFSGSMLVFGGVAPIPHQTDNNLKSSTQIWYCFMSFMLSPLLEKWGWFWWFHARNVCFSLFIPGGGDRGRISEDQTSLGGGFHHWHGLPQKLLRVTFRITANSEGNIWQFRAERYVKSDMWRCFRCSNKSSSQCIWFSAGIKLHENTWGWDFAQPFSQNQAHPASYPETPRFLR